MKKNRLVLVAVSAVIFAVVAVIMSRENSVSEKAAVFLDSVRQGQLAEAYLMTTPEFRTLVDRKQFDKLVNALRLRKSVSVAWTRADEDGRLNVRGELHFRDGSKKEFELTFAARNGLRISGFGTPRAVSVEIIPSSAVARRLVGQTLTDLVRTDKESELSTLYRRASREYRGELTLEELTTRFANLRDQPAVRQALEHGAIQNHPRPGLSHTGEITLRGQRSTPVVRADYRLRYRYEKPTWHVSGVDVSTKCRAHLHAERFLKAIAAGQLAAAYGETSQRFRRGSLNEFSSYVEGLGLTTMRSIDWDPEFRVLERSTGDTDAPHVVVSTGEVQTANGRLKIRVRSVGGADTWKVDAFGDVYPGANERHDMIRESLLRLARGVRSGDFSEFHRHGSKSFRNKHPLTALPRKFAVLVQRKIDLSSIANHDPVASESPVMRGRVLEASGIFHTNQIELTYRLQYVLESAAWKLDELDLEYNAGAMVRTEQFLKGMRQEVRAAVYREAASSFRKDVSLDELTDVVVRLGLDGFVSADWQSMHVKNNQALLTGTVQLDDGGMFLLTVGLVREDGEWRVANFNKSRGSLSAPPEAVVRSLVARSVRDLARAIAEDDFHIVISSASRLLKRATSATAVRGAFKGLSASGTDLDVVSGLEANLERLEVDNNGLLQVAGFFATPPSRIRFAMNYDFEGEQWKLADIKVRLVSAGELAARRFLDRVAAGDMDAAYAMTSPALRQSESQTRLSERMSRIGLDRYDSVQWTARKSSQKQIELEGQVHLFDGIEFYVKLDLQGSGADWQVVSVAKCRGPLTVPDNAELTQLVVDTMRPLQAAISSGDFEAWRDQSSSWMQSLKSAKQIGDDLKPLTDRKLDLSAVNDRRPMPVGQGTIDSSGRLVVHMRCAAQPDPVLAELAYTYESGWKLLDIKLTFIDQPPQ